MPVRLVQVSKGGPPDIDGENAVFFPCGDWFNVDKGYKRVLEPKKMSPEEGEVRCFRRRARQGVCVSVH